VKGEHLILIEDVVVDILNNKNSGIVDLKG
jgi:hypothetical protein